MYARYVCSSCIPLAATMLAVRTAWGFSLSWAMLTAIYSSWLVVPHLEGSIRAAAAGNRSARHFDAWWESRRRCWQGVTRRGAAVTVPQFSATRCPRWNFIAPAGTLPQASKSCRNKPPAATYPAITYTPGRPPAAASSSSINTSPIHCSRRPSSSPTTTPVLLPPQLPQPPRIRPILADTLPGARHLALHPQCPVPPAKTGRSSRRAMPMTR